MLEPLNPSLLGGLIICLQALIILQLAFRRRKYKRQRQGMKNTLQELELRVNERTERLRNINEKLHAEISKQEATEQLLRKAQGYLNSVINSMPSILIGVTHDGVITQWNSAAVTATQVPANQALGQPLHHVYPTLPIELETIQQTIDQDIPQLRENLQHQLRPDCTHVDLTIYPLSGEQTGAVIRLDDVSSRIKMEAMLIQSEKMMSLGELAAGMAHEINNPLSAILNGLQNIHRRTEPGLAANLEAAEKAGVSVEEVNDYLQQRDIYKFLSSIREAGERAAKIVTNMLEFSRTDTTDHQLVQLHELLDHSLELADNSFELNTADQQHPITIIREYAPNTPQVLCAANEIQQVVLNLLRNASQGFTQPYSNIKDAPAITLRTRFNDNNVIFEVADNGPGIPDEIKPHIFEPFFTTKEVGHGTGLGLSVSYFLVTEHHDGTIELDSQPGQGARFIISLPRH